MNSLLSLFMISGVPALSIMLISSKFVSNFKANGELEKIQSFRKKLFNPVAKFGAFIFFVLLLISPWVQWYLKLDSVIPVILVWVTLFFSFLLPVNLGALQGLQRFFPLGMARLLVGFLKLLFGAGFVLCGFALNGSIAGMVFSTITVIILTNYWLKALPQNQKEISDLGVGVNKIVSFGVPVVLNALGIMLLTNMDMVLVKHYFPVDVAGNYAKISVLGKTIFFLPGIIVMAMFPMASERFAQKKTGYRLLLKSMAAAFLLSGSGICIFWIFPHQMLVLLYGKSFTGADQLLIQFSLAMLFMSLINVSTTFSLAMEKKRFLAILFSAGIVLYILIHFFHSDLQTVIFMIIVTLTLCFTVLTCLTYNDMKGSCSG